MTHSSWEIVVPWTVVAVLVSVVAAGGAVAAAPPDDRAATGVDAGDAVGDRVTPDRPLSRHGGASTGGIADPGAVRRPDNETNDSRTAILTAGDRSSGSTGAETSSGSTRVIVEATNASALSVSRLRALGATVGSRHGRYVEVTATPGVRAEVRALSWVRTTRPVVTPVPAAVSEGVALIGADRLHRRGVTGEGVKVGVLTLGVRGDSPEYADQVAATRSFHPAGLTGNRSTHGTAVTEIVADTAPNASLYLASFDTRVDYADAVAWILEQDVDVVVMSVGYYREPDTGAGMVSETTTNATEAGVFWANAAGNSGNKHWQGAASDPDGDGWVNLEGDDESNALNDGESLSAGTEVWLSIKWDDFPTTDTDYTLYLFDENNETVATSSRQTDGESRPYEELNATLPSDGRYYVAVRGNASSHLVEVFASGSATPFEHTVANGSILAPAVAPGVTGVGAYHVDTGERAPYSSLGPTNDGRRGIDLLGPSKVTTEAYDFNFTGTSAAAPHVGGAAALLLAVNGSASAGELEGALMDTAEDVGPAGVDDANGAGKVDVDAAVDAVCGNDALEPNDGFDNATPVAGNRTTDRTVCGGENDVYAVEGTAGESLSADLTFAHATGDLDLLLFAPNGTRLALSVSETDNESLALDSAPVTGTYYVAVVGFDGATAPYDLSTRAGTASLVTDHHTCSAIDTDAGECPSGTVTDTFSPDDEHAVVWTEFGTLTTSHEVNWTWYTPAGDRYASSELTVNENGSRSSGTTAWSRIDVANATPADTPGEWRVEVAVDGEQAFTETFVVENGSDGGDGSNGSDGSTGVEVSRDLSTSEVSPGGSVEVTLTAEFSAAHDRVSVLDGFDGPVASSTVDAVRINGTDAGGSVMFQNSGTDSLAVALENVAAGSTVEVVYTVDVAGNAETGTNVTFTGNPDSNDVGAGDVSAEFGVDAASIAAASGPVDRADTDGNGRISTPELRVAIGEWSQGEYTTEELRTVIGEWARSAA